MLNRSLAAMMTLLPGAREVPASPVDVARPRRVVCVVRRRRRPELQHARRRRRKQGRPLRRRDDRLQPGRDRRSSRCSTSGFTARVRQGQTTVICWRPSRAPTSIRGSVFGYGRNETLIATDYFSKPENGGLGQAAVQPRPVRRLVRRPDRQGPRLVLRIARAHAAELQRCRGPTSDPAVAVSRAAEHRGQAYALDRAAVPRSA